MTAPVGSQSPGRVFNAVSLEQLFAACFAKSHATRLVGGAYEPLYRPAGDGQAEHLIYYREDYFASALHEVAHWCIAGPERRLREDFGYWYAPDGRSPSQQQAFEAVECKPQALEWLFSLACGYPFSVSIDNLDGESEPDTSDFRHAILLRAREWQAHGLPERAGIFFTALSQSLGDGSGSGVPPWLM
ncbi:MAG: elongation factor P hydroxylase, partial [Halioglobus sp.]